MRHIKKVSLLVFKQKHTLNKYAQTETKTYFRSIEVVVIVEEERTTNFIIEPDVFNWREDQIDTENSLSIQCIQLCHFVCMFVSNV